MKVVKIKKGPHKGKIGQILSEKDGEATVAIEGEEKPVKVKIDWIKVLNFLATILEIIKLSLTKKR